MVKYNRRLRANARKAGSNMTPVKTELKTQSRWKSPVFLSTSIIQLIAVLELLGVWNRLGLDPSYVRTVAAAILALIAMVIGNANNPTNPTGF